MWKYIRITYHEGDVDKVIEILNEYNIEPDQCKITVDGTGGMKNWTIFYKKEE